MEADALWSRRRFLASCACLAVASARCRAAAAPSAREVMQKSFESPRPDQARFSATMTLESPASTPRVRSMTTYLKRLDAHAYGRSVLFQAPANLARTATLTVERRGAEDDMWIFLPAMRKTRRLVSSNRRDAYIGSDFSFGDVLGHKVDDWTSAFEADLEIDGKRCWVVDNVAASEQVVEETGYRRMRTVIAQDSHAQLEVEYFDPAGEPLKRLVARRIERVDRANDKWQAMEMRMESYKSGRATTIEIADYDVKADVPPARFKPNSLDN